MPSRTLTKIVLNQSFAMQLHCQMVSRLQFPSGRQNFDAPKPQFVFAQDLL
jgi:hypothetical protein